MSGHPYDRYAGSPADQDVAGQQQAAAPPIEMFLVRPAHEGDGGLDQISDHVERLDGLILMATGGGGIIVGLPAGRKDLLASCPAVGFVGGVSFAEDAPGLAALQQKFAMNAARQLAARGRTWVGSSAVPGTRPATAAWGQRLVDPRSVLAAGQVATATAGIPASRITTQGDHQ